ncbi:hypothetical protein [Nitrogeniibacter mangrovi]|nr:hypothetical protein [Nitrogeniibacter mangrovi]
MSRFARLVAALRAWMKANAEAHAKAPTLPCCSAPPPGAGRHRR